MGEKRQNNQEQLAFGFTDGSEATTDETTGTETPRVERGAESPAGNPRVDSITHRTAVYGPVRTVVWEGRRSDPPPYPDHECVRHVVAAEQL